MKYIREKYKYIYWESFPQNDIIIIFGCINQCYLNEVVPFLKEKMQ